MYNKRNKKGKMRENQLNKKEMQMNNNFKK